MAYIAVVTTVGTHAQAQAMARALVERKLAACAQLTDIESFYVWDGALQNERECRILLKTRAECYPTIEAAIRELHTYELPAIHALPIEHIYPPYAQWIDDNT